jgi:hypothetical protein
VGPRAGLDNLEKREFLTLPGLELRPLVGSRYTAALWSDRFRRSHGRPMNAEDNITLDLKGVGLKVVNGLNWLGIGTNRGVFRTR